MEEIKEPQKPNHGCTAENLAGRRFGRLTVERYLQRPVKKGGSRWLVKCDCGKEKEVRSFSLLSGGMISCGCIFTNNIKCSTSKENRKTKEYAIWLSMLARCFNKKHHAFKDYGERGIDVCSAWKNSFDLFRRDMGERDTYRKSIDRIDNNGGYWCGKCEDCLSKKRQANCRWASQEEQCNNRRNSRKITYNGETKTSSEWARHFKIKEGVFRHHLNNGETFDQIARWHKEKNTVRCLEFRDISLDENILSIKFLSTDENKDEIEKEIIFGIKDLLPFIECAKVREIAHKIWPKQNTPN